jgi:hypothetical protein
LKTSYQSPEPDAERRAAETERMAVVEMSGADAGGN